MSEKPSQEDIQKLLQEMREWVNSQPHFPKDIPDYLLQRFIHSCYYDLEKAKTAAELFFTIRSSSPDLFTNRDPKSTAIQKTLKITNLAQLNLSGNRNLWIWQLNDPGLENYDYILDAKLFFLSTDAWLLDDKRLEEVDIAILDVKDISLKFLTKFNMSVARRMAKYQEDAMPIRLREIHLINTPSIIDKLFALMKPLLKQEITNMIHFHTPKSDTLYKYLSKEELPEDFGGTNGTLEDHMKNVLEQLTKHRDVLMNENLWRVADNKKSKNKSKENSIPVEKSFRSLDID